MGMYQLYSVRHRIFNKSINNNRAQLYKGFRKNKKVGEDIEQQIFDTITVLFCTVMYTHKIHMLCMNGLYICVMLICNISIICVTKCYNEMRYKLN